MTEEQIKMSEDTRRGDLRAALQCGHLKIATHIDPVWCVFHSLRPILNQLKQFRDALNETLAAKKESLEDELYNLNYEKMARQLFANRRG